MGKNYRLALASLFFGAVLLIPTQAFSWWGGDRWRDRDWHDGPGYYRHGGPGYWGGGPGYYGGWGGPGYWGGGPWGGWGGYPGYYGHPYGAPATGSTKTEPAKIPE